MEKFVTAVTITKHVYTTANFLSYLLDGLKRTLIADYGITPFSFGNDEGYCFPDQLDKLGVLAR